MGNLPGCYHGRVTILNKQAEIIEKGRNTLKIEAASLLQVAENLDNGFALAVELISGCSGRLVCSGMGKAGHIAMKVAATMASTGTPAFFVHPAEAVHGDLGMFAGGDVALLFSHSGETDELCRLLPYLAERRVTTIAITAHRASSLGQGCDVVLELGDISEACPLRLAPSSSTTCMLGLGDALAFAVLEARGFTADDFAMLHPGGSLGRSLSRVEELMRRDSRCPLVSPQDPVRQVVAAISQARSGCACIVDDAGHLLGVFTDGDFRRAWADDAQLAQRPVAEVMTRPGKALPHHTLVRDARALMANSHINALPVLDDDNRVIGLLDIQDL